MKIFINTDNDIRLGRKCINQLNIIVLRDIKERGRTIESVLHQYNSFSRKVFNEFVCPSMKYADLIIPYGRQNDIAVDFVVENIKTRTKEMGIKLSPVKPLHVNNSDNELIMPRVKHKETYGVVQKLIQNKENDKK